MPQDKQWECCQKCKAVGIPGMITTPWCDKWGNCPCHHTPTSPTQWHDSKHVKTLSEHTPTSPKSDWRNNILKTLGYDLDDEINIPHTLLNAIDAAYVAGLDDREKVVSKIEDWEKEFDEKFVSSSETYDVFTGTAATHPYLVKDFIRSLLEKQFALGQQNGMRKMLDIIAKGEGWEESFEHYKQFIHPQGETNL